MRKTMTQTATALVIVVSGALAPVTAQAAAPLAFTGTWSSRPPLQTARGGVGVTTAHGQIFAAGGLFTDGTPFDVVETRRVGGSPTWQYARPLPQPRGNLGVAALGGHVYAVGGYVTSGAVSDLLEAYDPQSGRWTSRRPLPVERSVPGVAPIHGQLYVAGGGLGQADLATNTVVAYDPRTDRWTNVTAMHERRERLRLVATGNYLYAIGGVTIGTSNEPRALSTVERYDPRTDRWQMIASMHQPRALPCAVATTIDRRDVIVVIAGNDLTPTNPSGYTTEVLDLRTGRWTTLDARLDVPRASHDCAIEASGAILTIGGFGPGPTPLHQVDALAVTTTRR